MRVAITGGSGYLGAELARRLALDHEVTIVDRHPPAREPGAPRVAFLERDVADPDQVRGVFDGLDIVFHRAGLSGNLPSMRDHAQYFRVNTMGTLNVLEACRAGAVKRFVFDSTEFVYGIAAPSPVSEEIPARPCSIYGATKRISEQLVLHFDSVFERGSIVLRFCRVRDAMKSDVVTAFARRIVAGESVTVAGGNALMLDYLDLGDAIRATIVAATSALRGQMVNVGPGERVALRDIIDTIQLCPGVGEAHAVEQPVPAGAGIRHEYQFGPDEFWLDVGKAERLLGWRPTKRIADSVRETVAAIQRARSSPG